MSLNWRNNRNFDYFSPKLRYFNTDMVVLVDFIKILIKSTRNILTIPTNTSKIEPIKAGFSTNDRFQNTAISMLGIYGSYAVGNWGCSILWQLYLPVGFAWLCERWYRILLIECLCLSLGCDTWFTISYANA